jgi:hypothetical protein
MDTKYFAEEIVGGTGRCLLSGREKSTLKENYSSS